MSAEDFPTIGDAAPAFSMTTDGGGSVALEDLKGKTVVLYFYPKDSTSGCTKQAVGFRDLHQAFTDAGAVIIGVSKDSIKSHDNFKTKQELPFTLGSDPEGAVCEAYGVWKEKSMYGKKYMGIERSTFVIDGAGVVRHVVRKVKVNGHVEGILDVVQGLPAA
ncbi:MAG: thioredoxin-dependent thiol peroxidase [Rhodospirillaceae bacterium]